MKSFKESANIGNESLPDKKKQTIKSYEDNATALAEKYDRVGARIADINGIFEIILTMNPFVLEIGSGSGRDAQEILKHTNKYIGIDASSEFVRIAKGKNPQSKFIVADIENYSFPLELDVIVAFASLLHVPKESLRRILKYGLDALNPGGVFRLSLKQSDTYVETTTQDEFGTRTYYLYSERDIREIIGGYTLLRSEIRDSQGQQWLEVLLQKPLA